MAAGAGFDDQTAPWGTQWMGKGAKNGAWNLNYKIPFQQSVKATVQGMDETGATAGFYFIIRGGPDLKINIGGVDVPAAKGAKMRLSNQHVVMQVTCKLLALSFPSSQSQHCLLFLAPRLASCRQ